MDNKQFPQQEDDCLQPLPAAEPSVPAEDTPPVIEELTFQEEAPLIQELSFQSEPEEIPEQSLLEPVSVEEAPARMEELIPEETPAEEALPDEATQIPEEPPEAPAPENLSALEPLPDISLEDTFLQQIIEEESPDLDPRILEEAILIQQEEQPFVQSTSDQEFQIHDKEFDELLQTPTKPEAPTPPPRQVNKGRPKRKKGEGLLGIPNILVTFVWLAMIVMIGVTAGRMLWVCAADVLAFGREDKVVTVTIYEADTMEDIVDKLHKNGLIRYKSLFQFYADISDAEEDIKPGIYDLNTRYDYHALVNFMSPRSSREVITLTIPEGYTSRQIFSLLEENRICTAQDIAAYAANGELNDYWFLENVERGTETCLEGYLFPDTYEFYKNSTPREALQRMLNNFEIKFDEEMRVQLDTLNAELTGDYTIREITIVASLIEKESAAPVESPKVAGVIYNRLFNWGSNPPYLNIDASIVYALDGKAELTREDLQTDHPYNTYTRTGLTPGPIANPGLASLKAALNPESHNYYYYVLNPATGMHQFSTTNEEHNAYVRQFAEAE